MHGFPTVIFLYVTIYINTAIAYHTNTAYYLYFSLYCDLRNTLFIIPFHLQAYLFSLQSSIAEKAKRRDLT
ncbi:hypothetical protein GDO81_009928 [Engystomops pustulosus]|uniref:Secreted protein n=1 Tax=Engystomops pustulosus TaxID=76066 RepID=A0AAV7BWG4_ENGPU|nr:hypothetical protein GDO81_009928 [Engystomops pustulosus]